MNGTASPPDHLSYPSSSFVPPLPGCLFQPCLKIHDSSFQSVMNGRWCHSRMHGTRTLHVQESRTRPCHGESGRSRVRARDRAWRLTSLSEIGTMAFLALASGGTSDSVHRQRDLFGNRDRSPSGFTSCFPEACSHIPGANSAPTPLSLESEKHLTISNSKYRPTAFQVS